MSYLTAEETKQIQTGISLFTRMIGLEADPVQGEFVAVEQDLLYALEHVRRSASDTRRMLGRRLFQGIDFDAPEAIRRDLKMYLLEGDDAREQAMLRKRNQPMYTLVIEPTVSVLAKYPHEEILDLADPVIDEVIGMVVECEDYGSLEDAKDAVAEYRRMVSERNAARELLKKKPRRARDSVAELFEDLDLSTDPDDE